MQTIDRAVEILTVLSKHPDGITVSELSESMQLSLGTTHRFLMSLMENNLVMQEKSSKQYRLGFKILRLASNLLNKDRLIEVARLPMRKAASEVNNIVYICQEHAREVLCTHCEDPTTETHSKFAAQIGNEMPFYAAATAKIIFAYQPDVLRMLFEQEKPLKRFTARTKTSLEAILEDSEKSAARGYAICDEELEKGVIALAAPIFNYEGKTIASVGVTGVKGNLSLQSTKDAICECARTISAELGFSRSNTRR